MDNLCKFKTEEEFRQNESELIEPWVVSVNDGEKVFYKGKEFYSIAYLDLSRVVYWGIDQDVINRYNSAPIALHPEYFDELIPSKQLTLEDLTSEIKFKIKPEITDLSYCFSGDIYFSSQLNVIHKVSLFDTSKVTNMSYMFENCYALNNVPLFDTSKVINMQGMFKGCALYTPTPYSIESIPRSSAAPGLIEVPLFDTNSVTNMNQMFQGCKALTNVPQFDTSKVTDMGYMFSGCRALTSVPKFDTSKVTNMSYMFSGSPKLTNVEFYGGMKPGCDCTDMFSGVTTKGTLYLDTRTPANGNTWKPVTAALPSTWTVVYRDEQ